MIVTVSTKPDTELNRALRAVRENYKRAAATNAAHPGMIRNPAAWALYRAWREIDAKRREGND